MDAGHSRTQPAADKDVSRSAVRLSLDLLAATKAPTTHTFSLRTRRSSGQQRTYAADAQQTRTLPNQILPCRPTRASAGGGSARHGRWSGRLDLLTATRTLAACTSLLRMRRSAGRRHLSPTCGGPGHRPTGLPRRPTNRRSGACSPRMMSWLPGPSCYRQRHGGAST